MIHYLGFFTASKSRCLPTSLPRYLQFMAPSRLLPAASASSSAAAAFYGRKRPDRGTGAKVEQLELKGQRLHYRLKSGPERHNVTSRRRGSDAKVRCDELRRSSVR